MAGGRGILSKVVLDFPFSLEYKTAKEYLENKNGHFTVQLGAFSKGKNAYRFSALLKNKGYDSYVEKKQEGDKIGRASCRERV